MKTAILTSVFAVLVSTMSLTAQNVKSYINTVNDEAGVKKEYIVMDKENGMPYKKDFYVYDNNGKIKERTIEIWNDLKGWVYYAKFEYKYTNDRMNDVLYTKWDHSKKRWSDKSELTTFLYNEDGKYLASEKASVNNNELITQK